MWQDQSSGVSDRGSSSGTLEFIAPLDVGKCAARLQGRHERRSFFAWDWQTRMTVNVDRVDERTVRFRMRRVDKNSLFAWGSMVEVEGMMRGISETQTAVRAVVHWSMFWVLIQLVAWCGMGAALVLGFYDDAVWNSQIMLRGVLGGLVGLLVGLAFTWWWGTMHLRGMIGALREATGYLSL